MSSQSNLHLQTSCINISLLIINGDNSPNGSNSVAIHCKTSLSYLITLNSSTLCDLKVNTLSITSHQIPRVFTSKGSSKFISDALNYTGIFSNTFTELKATCACLFPQLDQLFESILSSMYVRRLTSK